MYPSYPKTRMRRNRKAAWSRRLVKETSLSSNDLIWPLFVAEGNKVKDPVKSMPGVNRLSIDMLLKEVEKASDVQIPLVALFPHIDEELKDNVGKEATNSNNLICRCVKEIKRNFPNIGVMTDVALDPYTIHGHDGILDNEKIINDETIKVLVKQAIVQAEAGSDIIAPSDMMDGRIGTIREELDKNQFTDTQILSYAVKYASSFYGPFRNAVGSKLAKGNKKTYQMDIANSDEALREIQLDINEGADLVMVKPGLAYLDVVQRIKSTFNIPIVIYQVSGEYAMIKAVSEKGWLSESKLVNETLLSMKRAGACAIATYFAYEFAKNIKMNS